MAVRQVARMSPSILVVEDEPSLAQVLSENLVDEGYDVETVGTNDTGGHEVHAVLRDAEGTEGLRLVAFAIAQEGPHPRAVGLLDPPVLHVAVESRLVNGHDRP